jgi:transposase InsO family protein
MSKEKVQQLQSATEVDQDLKELNSCIKEGWPTDKSKVPEGAKPYWNYRDQIIEQAGLLFKGNKVIVPRVLRSETLKIIHNAHLGIEKCKRRARDILFWPGMNAEIEDLVKKCQVCQDHQVRNMREPLHPLDSPSRPWEIVATDLFELDGSSYLILVDSYSGFFEIAQLTGTKSSSVITHCKSQFARHGIPDTLISDNGPQFASHEFATFAQEYGFQHTTSSPHFPQSNGLAERYVQTAKNLLKKAKQAGTDPYLALLAYRNTPVNEKLGSPTQRLFGRRTKTTLPTSTTLLEPKIIEPKIVKETLHKNKEKQKQYFDHHTKELSVLQLGDNVRYETNTGLKAAVVIEKRKEPRSYMIRTSNGFVLRRNRKHLYESTGMNRLENCDLDDDNITSTNLHAKYQLPWVGSKMG